MKKVITIAGSDSSGGAGIQADLKTMMANGVYGMSAVTALTAQNTTGVYDIMEVLPDFLEKEINCCFEDIRPDAVKVGMVSNADLIEVIAKRLLFYQAENIVVDPVMVSTSGNRLLEKNALTALCEKLFPLAVLITPNLPEAEILCGESITTSQQVVLAAKKISEKYHTAVLLKGGHGVLDANDFLFAEGHGEWFSSERIDNPNTHGTGCTLSSAIASNLAKGYGIKESVNLAKEYIIRALKAGLDLGKGSGPLNHMV